MDFVISEVLKKKRIEKELNVWDVQNRLLQQFAKKVSISTIYKWESGMCKPDSETLLCLCEIYDIRDTRTFFKKYKFSPDESVLTVEDKYLLKAYHSAPRVKAEIIKIIGKPR